jgi:hypothetical protein
MIKLIHLVLFSVCSLLLVAQQTSHQSIAIEWKDGVAQDPAFDSFPYTFSNDNIRLNHNKLPVFQVKWEAPGPGKITIEVQPENHKLLDKLDAEIYNLGNEFSYSWHYHQEKEMHKYFIELELVALDGHQPIGWESGDIIISWVPESPRLQPRTPQPTSESVLSKGKFIKMSVPGRGVYRIDRAWLTSHGVPVDDLNPSDFQLYGHGGTMLPEDNYVYRWDDLRENAIYMVDGGDGSFDSGDYLLFYAPGHDTWYFDESTGTFRMNKNIYEDQAYYFLRLDGKNGLRAEQKPSLPNAEVTSQEFLDYRRIEEDKVNLLGSDAVQQGSGKQWFGDELSNTRFVAYPNAFSFPNIITDKPAYLEALFAGRSDRSSEYTVTIDGKSFSRRVPSTNLGYTSQYAKNALLQSSFLPENESFSVQVDFPPVGSASLGWLDYVQLNAWRGLIYNGEAIHFSDPRSLGYASYGFEIGNLPSEGMVWEISDPTRPNIVQFAGPSNGTFYFSADTLKSFYAFEPAKQTTTPEYLGEVGNQNLHGIEDLDMLVVFHENFKTEALRLAEHRSKHSNMEVVAVDIRHVYNEFASGSADPTALRDFARLLYERAPTFRFLLLFGDGSYDYRHRLKDTDNQNFVPTFQTDNSLDPIRAFPSDDYFGLLSPQEGGKLVGALELSTGRLPVKTIEEARTVVNKIIRYDSDPEMMGDWRTQLAFVADDEDSSQHLDQTDNIAQTTASNHPDYNLKKIYFDAFEQVSLAGGDRYPEATEEINRAVFKGVLSMVYLGHGGPTGWAQERVLKLEHINAWRNMQHYPILVTATCSFTGFDDPAITSAGELALLNPLGGMVALMSTTRLVYSTDNFRLTKAVYDRMFNTVVGQRPHLGDILKDAKNSNSRDTLDANSRKFLLFGDPSMQLAIPQYKVYTTHINGKPVSAASDTVRAMQSVTIRGYVGDEDGNMLSDFNGLVYPSVYDKPIELKTLKNDPGSHVRAFTLQTSLIFKGKASVKSSEFEFSFVVPKDINYVFGEGKVSYYAADTSQLIDAKGSYNGLIIGGTDPFAPVDDEGPVVEVFMNDTLFERGGITGPNPIIHAVISDDNGINITGNNIGHDLMGTLDNNSQNAFVMNDFFTSETDDFRKGVVRFPLQNIADGLHKIEVRAWDIANNIGIGETEFLVVTGEEGLVKALKAFPNPFVDRTFIAFEHNLEGGQMQIDLEIFNLDGRLVTRISATEHADSYRIAPFEWDATTQSGSPVAPGMYLYRVHLKYTDQIGREKISSSDTEKLLYIR